MDFYIQTTTVQRYNFFPNKQTLFLIILNKYFNLLIYNLL